MMVSNGSMEELRSIDRWPIDKVLRIGFLISIMCLTLIGNLYIVIKLYFRQLCQRTRLHLFILNLAFGDLMICFCTMTSELFLLIFDQEWILGNIACKLILYIQVVTLASTTFINMAMTFDRYEAICRPFRSRTALHRVQRIIPICWFCSLLIAVPQLFIFQETIIQDRARCASTGYSAEWQRRVYFTTFACYVLIIPALCMTIWYVQIIYVISSSNKVWTQTFRRRSSTILSSSLASRTKLKTVKLALTIIIVFVACWTPYIVTTLIEIYSNKRVRVPTWFDGVLQMICFLQSGLNPLIYMIFNHRRKTSTKIPMTSTNDESRKSLRSLLRHCQP